MQKNMIRPLALAIIKNRNKVLVCLGHDKKINKKFYRLPGGGIEFGETAVQALRREFKEEFGTELKNIKFLGILENIFVFENKKGHEIAFIYSATIKSKELLKHDLIKILDKENDFAVWEDITKLKKGHFYPEGISKFFK